MKEEAGYCKPVFTIAVEMQMGCMGEKLDFQTFYAIPAVSCVGCVTQKLGSCVIQSFRLSVLKTVS